MLAQAPRPSSTPWPRHLRLVPTSPIEPVLVAWRDAARRRMSHKIASGRPHARKG